MINNIDINKIVVSKMFTYGEQDFKYFIFTKIIKKLDLYAYYFQKWVYIRYSDKNECMCFMIKDLIVNLYKTNFI